MTTSVALSRGARLLLRHKKVIVFFYLVNIAAAVLAVAPLAAMLGARYAHSLESDRLFSNFDPAALMEMVNQYTGAPWTAVSTAGAVIAGLMLMVSTFLAGGAIAVFHDEDDTFFGASARFFGRLFRLMLISLVFYGIAIAAVSAISALLAHMRRDSMVAWPWVLLNGAQFLLILALFGIVNMIFDFAKIECVAGLTRSALRATLRSIRFVFRNPGRAFGVYWVCALISGLLLLAYHLLTEVMGQGSAAMVIAVLVTRQVYVLARISARLWTWSSELGIYTFREQVLAAATPEPEPPLMPQNLENAAEA